MSIYLAALIKDNESLKTAGSLNEETSPAPQRGRRQTRAA